jgi:arsenate reductase (thioredoxin)
MQTMIPARLRNILILIVCLIAGCAEEVRMKEPTNAAKRVLFVCIENSNRSQMAEAFARRIGHGKVEAFSAGSRPSGRVNPRAIEFMREIGYDLNTHQSKGLGALPEVEFDAAVTMGCGDECPTVRAKRREDWNIPDPKEMPAEEFRKVRDLIQRKVEELLKTL